MKTLILTMGDDGFKPVTDIAFPRIKKYAERIGADFMALTDRHYPTVNICYEKFRARGLLDRYSRIAYIDGDVFVKATAPNVFDFVPFRFFSAVDERKCLNLWNQKNLLGQAAPYGWIGPWEGPHFNAGVMVFDETHKRLFENPRITNQEWYDQPCLNVGIHRFKVPFLPLPVEFNTMPYHGCWAGGEVTDRAYFIHFAGTSMEWKVKGMAEMARKFDGV